MNLSKYIDKDPPLQSDSKSLLDYLAYLKEQINFLFHNWSRSVKDANDKAAAVEERTSGGYVAALSNTGVRFSNGVQFQRGRLTQAPDSSTGEAVGGLYRYKITLNGMGNAEQATNRPIVVGDVYVNSPAGGWPADYRVLGSANNWTRVAVTFLCDSPTLSTTVVCEYIMGFTL